LVQLVTVLFRGGVRFVLWVADDLRTHCCSRTGLPNSSQLGSGSKDPFEVHVVVVQRGELRLERQFVEANRVHQQHPLEVLSMEIESGKLELQVGIAGDTHCLSIEVLGASR